MKILVVTATGMIDDNPIYINIINWNLAKQIKLTNPKDPDISQERDFPYNPILRMGILTINPTRNREWSGFLE